MNELISKLVINYILEHYGSYTSFSFEVNSDELDVDFYSEGEFYSFSMDLEELVQVNE